MSVVPPVDSYSGPSTVNDFLHGLAHCTFEHGCHYLPFKDDTDRMVEPHEDAPYWLESVLLIGFVPFTAIFLYLLIDSLYRCIRHCCCRKHVDGCCAACCARDVDDSDETFITSSRVTFGSRTYGAAGGDQVSTFPSAEVLPATPGHNPKRGGVAAQQALMFSSPSFPGLDKATTVDPNNPFHTSSRLLAVTQQHDIEQEIAVQRKSYNPDRNYDGRTLISVVLSLAGLILLGVSIAMSQAFTNNWNDVEQNVAEVHDYFAVDLQQGGLGALISTSSNLAVELNLLAGAAGLPQQYVDEANQLAGRFQHEFTPKLEPFSIQLTNQTQHFQDAKDWMAHTESQRATVVYTIIGVTMAFAVLMLMVHVYLRQRPCLSLTVRSIFAFLLLGTLLLFSASLSISVATSDICQAPLQYANSLLNSSVLTDAGDSSFTPEDVEIVQFYLNCPQPADGASSAIANPLFAQYFLAIPIALESPGYDGALSDLLGYLAQHPQYQSYQASLTTLNATMWMEVEGLGLGLACEQVHNGVIDSLQLACHPATRALWIQSVLLFFGVFALLVVRCLVWMRVKKHNEFDDDHAIDDAVNPASREPFGVGGFSANSNARYQEI
jgi:hypothetical protein